MMVWHLELFICDILEEFWILQLFRVSYDRFFWRVLNNLVVRFLWHVYYCFAPSSIASFDPLSSTVLWFLCRCICSHLLKAFAKKFSACARVRLWLSTIKPWGRWMKWEFKCRFIFYFLFLHFFVQVLCKVCQFSPLCSQFILLSLILLLCCMPYKATAVWSIMNMNSPFHMRWK